MKRDHAIDSPGSAPLAAAGRALIADDIPVNRFILEHAVRQTGFEPVTADDGDEAIRVLRASPDIRLVLLDWMMPGRSGVEVCRWIRAQPWGQEAYIIIITSRDQREDLHTGLEAGADDYLTKPVDPRELQLRLGAGTRILGLQKRLAEKIVALEQASTEVRTLRGLLPMCMYCKQVRDDEGYWESVDVYLRDHTDASVSHGICPDCAREHFGEYLDDEDL